MAKTPDKKTDSTDKSTGEEARHLAEEAMEEMKGGNKEEAEFILGEARGLDKNAVDAVLKEKKKSS